MIVFVDPAAVDTTLVEVPTRRRGRGRRKRQTARLTWSSARTSSSVIARRRGCRRALDDRRRDVIRPAAWATGQRSRRRGAAARPSGGRRAAGAEVAGVDLVEVALAWACQLTNSCAPDQPGKCATIQAGSK